MDAGVQEKQGLEDADMRKLLLIICAAMGLLAPSLAGAGSFNAQGQFVGRTDDRLTSLLAQFPAGGPPLRAAMAALLESDPSLADDAVFAALNGTPEQKQAIGSGVADAARFFDACATCQAAGASLRHAMTFADEPTRTVFSEAIGSNTASNIAQTPPIFIPGTGGSKCVSPSAPNGC